MKFHRLRTVIPILGIFIFLIAKSFNLSVIAAPLNDNVFDMLQTVDKESNVTANTRKLTFKLLLNPVDKDKHNLPFHLKLKSSVWLTNDEFLNLKNYLGDRDLANALTIVRRKFFRRFHSKNLPQDALKYRLLSALVFSSLQGQINVLRNRLNNPNPELLLSVSDFQPAHKDPLQWKPLESKTQEFEFHVENGNLEPPTTPSVTIGSMYDKNYYEKVIFNSIKPLVEFSETLAKPKQEPKTSVESNTNEANKNEKDLIDFNTPPKEPPKPQETQETQPTGDKTPEQTTQETRPEEQPTQPTPTNENQDNNVVDKENPPVKHTEETIGGRTRSFDYDQLPASDKESVKQDENKEGYKSEASSVRSRPTRRRRSRDQRNADFYREKDRDLDEDEEDEEEYRPKPPRPALPGRDKLKKVAETLTSLNPPQFPLPKQKQEVQSKQETEQQQTQPEPKELPEQTQQEQTRDNNVVDKENPVPTEEVKSKETTEKEETTKETQPEQTQPEQVPQEQVAQENLNKPTEPQPTQNKEQPQPTQNKEQPQPKPKELQEQVPDQLQSPKPVQQPVQNVEQVNQQPQNVKPVQLPPQLTSQKTGSTENQDNNVVDKENPVPTEEVKSKEEEQKTTENVPKKPDQTSQSETEPEPAGGSISNVRKGTDSNMKTTFSLGENVDGSDTEPTFFKKPQHEPTSDTEQTQSQTQSSESESESESPEGSVKTEEQMLKDLEKRFPPYNETNLMNLYEKVDTEDVEKDFKSPVTITLKVNFMSSDKRVTVPVVTTARLLLPQTIFTMCIREELTQQCAFELKDRLMARFEENKAQAFKWGRLVSLLQTLAFQNDVFVEKYVMNKGEESVIELSRPTFMLPMKTLNFLKQLVGKASSTDGNAQITFDLLPGILNIPVGSLASDLGQNYGTHAQLSRFIELYGDFEVTHSLFDLPKQQKVTKKLGGSRPSKIRARDNRVYTMEELLSMNVDTKDLNNDIHFILSSYEKALYSVPKRLSGYKLLWETVDKYPELQRLWIEALTLMKLMDKKDNLKNFLANHTFKYQELKDLFEITYGIIAADNFHSVREFYETVGITQKDVDTNLARVRSLFFAKTGSNVTRLPPILKQMHPKCLIKNMITSLSSNDLIERMQVMFVQWINDYKDSDETNYNLAFLCAGSAILLQHWHYFQLDQNYYDHPVPFITLITSFSRLAQGKYKNPERKKEIKNLINSKAAKQCRKYINSAGILATSPYKTATINMTPKSLLGAIGNALDVSMDSPPVEVAFAMKDYFKAELSKGKYGNSLGICLGLQLLYRLHRCFSVERSNDFSLYMHGLLTMDTRTILEKFTEIEANSKNKSKNYNFIKFACNPDNPTVHETMTKLMPLVSTQSHLDLIEELIRRDMLSPDLTPEGYLEDNENTVKDVVDLEDDTTTLLETFEDTNPRSLLELADEVSYENDNEETEDTVGESFIQQNYTQGGYGFDVDVVGMPNLDEMDKLYKKLFAGSSTNPFFPNSLNNKVLNQLFNKNYNSNQVNNSRENLNNLLDDDLTMITFDIRMEPLDSQDDLIALDVPFSFHERELDLIESLESKALLRLLLYRIKKRIDSLEFDLKHEKLKKQALDLAKSKNLEHISIPVHENIAKGNVDFNTYTGLLRVLESMPEDGYYFEHEGLVIPEQNVGKVAAKRIYKTICRNKANKSNKKSKNKNLNDHNEPILILQVIDPVDDTNITDLTMPHEHVKKHDKLFYQKMTEL